MITLFLLRRLVIWHNWNKISFKNCPKDHIYRFYVLITNELAFTDSNTDCPLYDQNLSMLKSAESVRCKNKFRFFRGFFLFSAFLQTKLSWHVTSFISTFSSAEISGKWVILNDDTKDETGLGNFVWKINAENLNSTFVILLGERF